MKTTMKICLGLVLILTGQLHPVSAETIYLNDTTLSINLPSGLGGGGVLSGRWGTWDASTGTFTQQVTNSLNAGYVDLTALPTSIELSITLNQTLNLGQSSGSISGVYAPGTLLALAIFTNNGSADVQASNYNATWARAILTDASWLTPTFANNANPIEYGFTANTAAVVGSFNFNGGNEQISLVPEPSTGALMMIGAAGLVALRRLRKV